jgi:hippurate hydrolase
MDALPMQRRTSFAHKSRYDGRMHGCGHDGHTTMLFRDRGATFAVET